MVSKGEKELVEAIHEAEESEHKLEERVESLKHKDEDLHAPDAISKALTSGPMTREPTCRFRRPCCMPGQTIRRRHDIRSAGQDQREIRIACGTSARPFRGRRPPRTEGLRLMLEGAAQTQP